ncbi:hypothetical protein PTSG_09468 [Salpingoeca rosetta]|uniref:EF-hand domain-containing protein n=1 Tax=Salpingoeca rosetta (strain ATCC 50818 / BSB-021) TaxID=946362 RepID=F2UL36_SALR5|nr:uncharacterized protein PTSG_09468 [Salpingoeca rosetta]EGD77835.1 hypothetical protein PTSG_09468 [Salpingoeca rosetta]|eukprot:XP_004989899.1 hypothetical protein PTSG_09468 [Salpingoeca rosetta]
MQTHPGNGQPTNQRAAQMGKTRRTRRAGGDGGDGAAGIEVAWLAVNPDGDDRITRKQLLDAVHFMGFNPTKKVMRDFAAEVAPADELYSMEDLRTLTARIPPTTADDLVQAFKIIDENGDGSLSRKELEKALMNYGERMTRSEVEDVMKFDTDKSGSIEYHEFCNMCLAFADQIKQMQPPPSSDNKNNGSTGSRDDHAEDDDNGSRSVASSKRRTRTRAGPGRRADKTRAERSGRSGTTKSGRLPAAAVRRTKKGRTTQDDDDDSEGDGDDDGDDDDRRIEGGSKSLRGRTKDARDTEAARRRRRGHSSDDDDGDDGGDDDDDDGDDDEGSRSRRGKDREVEKKNKKEQDEKDKKATRPSATALKAWTRWELFGRIQAQKEGPPSSQLFEIKPTKKTRLLIDVERSSSSVDTTSVSPGCVIVDENNKFIGRTRTRRANRDVQSIIVELDPGTYTIVPTSQPTLKPRDEKKAKKTPLAPLCITDDNDAKSFTEQATTALDEAFRSFDTRRNGRLSRSEYNALLKQTDGEECEDDVWEFIIENFDAEEGELTRRGFFQIYTQLVADEDDDDAVYPHFEHLGFNRKLEMDEVVLWKMTCYAAKPGAVSDISLHAFDGDVASAALSAAESDRKKKAKQKNKERA